MKHLTRTMTIVVAALFMVACASTEYIISTNDGTMITTRGKPKLDEETGMYTYKGADGREVSIKKEDVKQIMER